MSGASLARSWVERDLQAGDLRVLSNVAFRRTLRPHSDPVERLSERGFLVKTTPPCTPLLSDDPKRLDCYSSSTYFCAKRHPNRNA
jgi:hypothetical protein